MNAHTSALEATPEQHIASAPQLEFESKSLTAGEPVQDSDGQPDPDAVPSQKLGSWLNAARGPYLNFLRNLTPQVFLASMAWLFGARLNFQHIDLANWLPTLGFWLFLALFIFSVYSNATLFAEEAFADLSKWVKYQENLRFKKYNELQGKRIPFFRVLLSRPCRTPATRMNTSFSG